MNESTKRTIAASAELLQERVRNGHTVDGEMEGLPDAAKRFDESVVTEFEEYFSEDVDAIAEYVYFDSWPEDEPLPEWVGRLSTLVEYCRGVDDPASIPDAYDDEVPFVTVLAHFVASARHHHVDADRLSADVLVDFETDLLDRLADLAAQALHIDFVTYVAERDPSVVEESERSPDSTEWYDEYVAALFDGRLTQFFESYPVLARRLTTVTRQWGAAVSRFAARLRADYDALRSLVGSDFGRACRADPGAGDAHGGGESVVVVTFESGDEVVYKPRSVEPEARLYEFESWLADRFEAVPALTTPDVLTRSGYGWVTSVEQATFSDETAVAEYYRRAGALLCVLYVLYSSDCHFENIVAGETSPVLVDAETVPDPPGVHDPDAGFEAEFERHAAESSVLHATMLPCEIGNRRVESSGLGMVEQRDARRYAVSWTHVNTDAMDVEYRPKTTGPGQNFPIWGGEPAPPEPFVDELVAGFEATYEAILSSRSAVKRRAIEQFSGLRVRNVLHRSRVYGALLNTLTNPKYLRSGVRSGCKIQTTLAGRFADHPRDTTDVVAAERTAIARCDVPRFTMQTGSTEVRFDGETVYDVSDDRTCLDRLRSRIEGLSEADLAHQTGLIRACFETPARTTKGHQCGEL